MWTLYDTLIEGIPEKERVDEVISGSHWTMVRSGDQVGRGHDAIRCHPALNRSRLPLRRGYRSAALAACAKSWNFAEATVGSGGAERILEFPPSQICGPGVGQ